MLLGRMLRAALELHQVCQMVVCSQDLLAALLWALAILQPTCIRHPIDLEQVSAKFSAHVAATSCTHIEEKFFVFRQSLLT